MRLNRTGWQWGKALSQLGKKTVKNTNMTFRGTALMLVAVCAFTAALVGMPILPEQSRLLPCRHPLPLRPSTL